MNTLCVLCSSCNQLLDLQSFTKNQLKKKREPRCKSCVQTEVLGKIKGENKSWEVLRVPANATTSSWPQASFRPKTAVFVQNQDNPLNPLQNNDNSVRVLVARDKTTSMMPQTQHVNKRDPSLEGKYRSFSGPHTTAINVPVNISVDHSRSKVYQVMGDSAGEVASHTHAFKQQAFKPTPSKFIAGDAGNADFAGSNASIRPIISETTPSSVQYSPANAQMIPVAREGVAETTTTQSMESHSVQFLEWQDGSKYYGNIVNGCRHGKGIFIWSNGSRYDGEWFKNEMHGSGTLLLVSSMDYGSTNWKWYNGNFQNGKYHGDGIFNWPDGSIYEGQWKQSRPHGYGSYESKAGGKYIGEWRYGTQYGTGTCLYSNGIMYTGEFKNNLRHGVGTCQWPNGSSYSGLWDNNEMRNPSNMKILDSAPHATIDADVMTPNAHTPSMEEVNNAMDSAEFLRAYLKRGWKKKNLE